MASAESEDECLKCGRTSTPGEDDDQTCLHRYKTCGHVMCTECLATVGVSPDDASSTEEDVADCASEEISVDTGLPLNEDCPVCQRQLLLKGFEDEEFFPPYLRRFSIVRKALDQQVPQVCGRCTGSPSPPTSQCLDCKKYLCEDCYNSHDLETQVKHRIFKLSELKRSSLFEAFNLRLVSLEDPTLCKIHVGTTLIVWCKTCAKAICQLCKRHHMDHDTILLEERQTEVLQEVRDVRETMSRCSEDLQASETSHKVRRISIQNLCTKVKSTINDVVEKRKKLIDSDAERLYEEVDEFLNDFNQHSHALIDLSQAEATSLQIWDTIYGSMCTESGDVADNKLLDFHEFISANRGVLREQEDVALKISNEVNKLMHSYIVFKESELKPDEEPGRNKLGKVIRRGTASLIPETCPSREGTPPPPDHLALPVQVQTEEPSEESYDDAMFNIDDSQLWRGDKIDTGPSSVIYKGVYKRKGVSLPVAIKELDAKSNRGQREGLIKEANKMKHLDHDNIIKFIGLCKSQTFLLVTDLPALGPLAKYLKNHPETVAITILDILHQLTLAMKYLEEQRIVHRCVTARAVFLTTPLHVKLGSFGMALVLEKGEDYFTEKSVRLFPLKWYPPESIYKFQFDSKCDVWSYGVVMWQAFSHGAKPYQNKKGPDILTMIEAGERLEKPDSCPESAYDVMKKCWMYRKSERPTFVELEHTLTDLIREEKVEFGLEAEEVS